MNILILGIVIFFSIHCVPIIPSLRNNLSSFLGDNGYKAFYSLLAFAGLGLIVYGFSIANSYPLWKPFPYSHAIAVWVMPFSFILLTASSMKTNIKRYVRHPMLTGVLIWSLTHLIANGDVRSLLLFASFGLYSLVDMLFTKKNIPEDSTETYPVQKDITVIVIGLIVYGIGLYIHTFITGVSAIK